MTEPIQITDDVISMEAESGLIGCLIAKPDQLGRISKLVRPMHFAVPPYRIIYEAMLDIHQRGEWPTESGETFDRSPLMQILFELRRVDKMQVVGGMAWVMALEDEAGMGLNIGVFVTELFRVYAQRELNDAADGLRVGGTLEEKEQAFKATMTELKALHYGGDEGSTSDVWLELENHLESETSGGVPVYTYTGLDSQIGRLPPGFVVTIGARTSMGKSVFAAQTALRNAMFGVPTAFFSLEMKPRDMVARLACATAGINTFKLLKGQGKDMDDKDWDKLMAARSKIIDLPLYWPPVNRGLDMGRLEVMAEMYVREKGVRLLVVDHIRLINAGGKTIFERVSGAMDRLATLAAELDVSILAVSQINREGGKADRPAIHHLEGSGAIEQDSETIILLHGPSPDSGLDRSQLEGIVGKSRDGITGVQRMVFEPEYSRIDHGYFQQKLHERQQLKGQAE